MRYKALMGVGVFMMAWGGASISNYLGLTGWAGANIALFALGIVAVASAPIMGLNARLRSLEDELKARRA